MVPPVLVKVPLLLTYTPPNEAIADNTFLTNAYKSYADIGSSTVGKGMGTDIHISIYFKYIATVALCVGFQPC
jgi:hypothetical protein